MVKVIESEIVHVGRFNVSCEKVDFGKGVSPFSYIKMKPGVCVIPILNNNQVLLLSEYRHALKSYELEFPCGIIDPNETPEQAAKRELLEETGYTVTKLIDLGNMYPSFGSTDEKTYMFAAYCTKTSEPKCEASELIQTEIKTFDNVDTIVKTGEMKCAAGIVAWYRLLDHLKSSKI